MKIVKEYTNSVDVDVIEIKSAIYVGNHIIRIDFNDNVSRKVDFKPFLKQALHPSIRKYLNESKFQQFTIIDGNLNWNDYELIFPLEELYNGEILRNKK